MVQINEEISEKYIEIYLSFFSFDFLVEVNNYVDFLTENIMGLKILLSVKKNFFKTFIKYKNSKKICNSFKYFEQNYSGISSNTREIRSMD